jgi:hypothetical protein
MPPEVRAALWSEMLATMVCVALFSFLGYGWIPDIDDTFYPYLGGLIFGYLFIGGQVLPQRGISPPASAKIAAGQVDLGWGLRLLYWQCWWPMYWRKK